MGEQTEQMPDPVGVIPVRCKMRLASLTEVHYNRSARIAKFQAEYDSKLEEDKRFSKATPSGSIELHIDNPIAVDRLVLGRAYYFDMIEADAA